jgi:hypothetical protein
VEFSETLDLDHIEALTTGCGPLVPIFSYGLGEQLAIGSFFNIHKRGANDAMSGLVASNVRGDVAEFIADAPAIVLALVYELRRLQNTARSPIPLRDFQRAKAALMRELPDDVVLSYYEIDELVAAALGCISPARAFVERCENPDGPPDGVFRRKDGTGSCLVTDKLAEPTVRANAESWTRRSAEAPARHPLST